MSNRRFKKGRFFPENPFLLVLIKLFLHDFFQRMTTRLFDKLATTFFDIADDLINGSFLKGKANISYGKRQKSCHLKTCPTPYGCQKCLYTDPSWDF